MTALRFIHMADAHLGRPFSGLTRSLPGRAEVLSRACRRAWDRIVETAIRERVDFLTIGGDTFDRSNPGLRPRAAFRDGVKRLREAGIPVLMVTGNHDPLTDFPEDLKGLPGLHLFGPEPEAKRMDLPRSGPTVNVYGAGFERSSVRENLVRRFPRDPGGDFSIGLVHANVSGSSGHEDYAPCSPDDLKRSGMDIWCLGHVHRPRILCEHPLIIYPGTLQGAHVKETGPHGAYLLEADDRAAARAIFIPAAPVRWEELELNLSEISSPEEFTEAAAEACSKIQTDDDNAEALVVRIVLRGERSVYAEDWRRGEGEILEALADRLFQLSTPVFPESIRDGTEPSADLESLMRKDDFLAEFFEITREAETDRELREELVAALDEELLRLGLRRFLRPDRDPRALLEDRGAFQRTLRDVRELVAREFLHAAGA